MTLSFPALNFCRDNRCFFSVEFSSLADFSSLFFFFQEARRQPLKLTLFFIRNFLGLTILDLIWIPINVFQKNLHHLLSIVFVAEFHMP